MFWINFLHCYQPVNTDAHVIKEATEKSYRRIIKALEKNSHIKFTLNVSGCLLLRWEDLGYTHLSQRLADLWRAGQVEIVGTACYHPLLPLIPIEEVVRQIKENEEIMAKHFGADLKPRGFFLPEMAYSPEVARVVKDFGYEWLILDEIAHHGELGKTDFDSVYLDKNSGLKIIFRDRNASSRFVPEYIGGLLSMEEKRPVITATDGELYGLRHIDHSGEFEKLLKRKDFETITISEFISQKTDVVSVEIVPCSWESTEVELKNGIPYALWFNAGKKIQQHLWELANLAYETIEKNHDDDNYYWARWHLVRGLASCTFWWASEKDFRHIFGPLAWNPDEIERGINELIRAVRALENDETREVKIEAEKLYLEIKRQVWSKHWGDYWKK